VQSQGRRRGGDRLPVATERHDLLLIKDQSPDRARQPEKGGLISLGEA